MDPGIIKQLAVGALVPGTVGAVLWGALFWRGSARPMHRLVVEVAGAGIVCAVLFAGLSVTTGSILKPVKSSQDLHAYIAVLSAGVGLLAGLCSTNGGRLAVWLAGSFAVALTATRSGAVPTWSWLEQGSLVGGLMLAGTTMCWGSHAFARSQSGRLSGVALTTLCAVGAQIVVIGFSSLLLGQVAGLAAAVLGSATAIAFLRWGVQLPVAATTGAMLFLVGAMSHGSLFGKPDLMPALLTSAALPVSAAILGGLGVWWRVKGQSQGTEPREALSLWRVGVRWALALMAAAIPGSTALGVSLMQQKAEGTEQEAGEYDPYGRGERAGPVDLG